MRLPALVWLGVALAAGGCDRNVEPFVPGEKVEPPDLAKIFPPGAERAAAQEMGAPAPPPAPMGPAAGLRAGAAGGAPIRGSLSLAPDLAGRMPPGGVLFLIARSAAPGPPVAVKRVPTPTFPMDFELGPDDRMIQSIPFAGPLLLSARIDADGNAASRSPGDLQGALDTPVEPGASGVQLVIDEVL
jgi:cytochrome c-type biogenesis protein CcmH